MNRRSKLFGLGLPVLGALGACSVIEPSSYGQRTDLYFIDRVLPVTVDRDYKDRYACRNGKPLMCRCTASRLGTCRCGC
jgi:hypothetical protein